MAIEIRMLNAGAAGVLARVAPDVFDDPVDPGAAAAFLADPRHHIAVALDGDVVVGFVSAVHYLHTDKPAPELWINEVGVAPACRRLGLATSLLQAVLDAGRRLGCAEAWILTDRSNESALRLYAAAGGGEPSDQVMVNFDLTACESIPGVPFAACRCASGTSGRQEKIPTIQMIDIYRPEVPPRSGGHEGPAGAASAIHSQAPRCTDGIVTDPRARP